MDTKIKLILPTSGKNTKVGVLLDLKQGERLYFLAGPIRGGGDWQAKAVKLLHEKDPFCYTACPCRYGIEHELFQYRLEPTKLEPSTDDERELPDYALNFPNKTLWERYYLEQASWFGSVIFWLAGEDPLNPRKKEEGPYAQDTYGELGRWSVRSSNGHTQELFSLKSSFPKGGHLNLVVGAEEKFPGLSVIQKNFDADHGKKFTIHSSLEDTITEAVKLGKKANPQPMNFND